MPVPPVNATLLAHYSAKSLGLINGDPVSQWTDLVGTNHLTASGVARPTYRTAKLGPHPGVNFDGVDDVVAAATSISAGHAFVVAAYDLAMFNAYDGLLTDTTSTYFYIGDANKEIFYDSTVEYRKDGVLSRIGPMSGSAAILDAARSVTLIPQVGRDRPYTNRYWEGPVFEVLMFSVALSSGDRQSIQNYLFDEWFATGATVMQKAGGIWKKAIVKLKVAGSWQDATVKHKTGGEW